MRLFLNCMGEMEETTSFQVLITLVTEVIQVCYYV